MFHVKHADLAERSGAIVRSGTDGRRRLMGEAS
jgi:hypothetical protein